MRGSQLAQLKWSWILMDWNETQVDWSCPICAGTEITIFGYATRGPSLLSNRNEKMALLGARVHLESWNLVCRDIFWRPGKLHGLFCSSAIYSGSSFSDWNKKMGTNRVRVHLESSILVCGHIFWHLEKWHGLFCSSSIYRGCSFCDRNKNGNGRVRIHLESSNLVCRHNFWCPEKWQCSFVVV